jgi:hypothetical protein
MLHGSSKQVRVVWVLDTYNTNNALHKRQHYKTVPLVEFAFTVSGGREQPWSSHPAQILRRSIAFIRLYSYYIQAIQSLFAHALDFFTLFALSIIPTVRYIRLSSNHADLQLQARRQEKQTHVTEHCAKHKRF